MRLAFSIPVHEKSDVVDDLIRNVLYFNPGSVIVLHVSNAFADFDPSLWVDLGDVVINPQRYPTQHGKGLMTCHVSNFSCLEKKGIGFDTFCLMSSNEKFIRPGLSKYIENAGNGFSAVPFDLAEDWHIFARRINRHPMMRNLYANLGKSAIFGGQAEGQFFEKAVFAKIRDHHLAAFGETPNCDFETEEVVPQTVGMALGIRPALPFTLQDYSHAVGFQITEEVVRLLADPALVGKVLLDLGPKSPLTMRSPHHLTDNRSVFSVKRVKREIDDPVRVFINKLPALAESGYAPPMLSPGTESIRIPLIPEHLRKPVTRPVPPSFFRVMRYRLGLRTRVRNLFAKMRRLFC
jgi:hypothetical protein